MRVVRAVSPGTQPGLSVLRVRSQQLLLVALLVLTALVGENRVSSLSCPSTHDQFPASAELPFPVYLASCGNTGA